MRMFKNEFQTGTEDYFSRTMGYVIEDRSFADINAAIRHLTESCYMTAEEAESYCSRMKKEFIQRNRYRDNDAAYGKAGY